MIAATVSHAYGAVRLALQAAREPARPETVGRLTEDQVEEIERHLAIARGALTVAFQITEGRLPDDVLAEQQERARRGP